MTVPQTIRQLFQSSYVTLRIASDERAMRFYPANDRSRLIAQHSRVPFALLRALFADLLSNLPARLRAVKMIRSVFRAQTAAPRLLITFNLLYRFPRPPWVTAFAAQHSFSVGRARGPPPHIEFLLQLYLFPLLRWVSLLFLSSPPRLSDIIRICVLLQRQRNRCLSLLMDIRTDTYTGGRYADELIVIPASKAALISTFSYLTRIYARPMLSR